MEKGISGNNNIVAFVDMSVILSTGSIQREYSEHDNQLV